MPDEFESVIRCPACHSLTIRPFYDVRNVPVHSVLLLDSREEAVHYPKGDIDLAFCSGCGFIFNRAFHQEHHEYSDRYDPTQGYSPTFNTFHRQLVLDLIERYDLRHKTILEIGCGQGEFLTLLCELGDNHGTGFDPAYLPVRKESSAPGRTHFIADYYAEKYSDYRADFVCCKMTLEHIPNVSRFVQMVRRTVATERETVIFFQVPDTRRILRDAAFWDIYYEHASYFTLGSLARLFRRCGFMVLDLWRAYDDQYLMLTARINGAREEGPPHPGEDSVEEVAQWVAHFEAHSTAVLARWRQTTQQFHENGDRVVLWGGGSKAVAFLTTVGVESEISYVVDINPRKHGTFIAGTGHQIVAPTFLPEYRPTVVLIMNAIYRPEIAQTLAQLGLSPALLTVEDV